MDIRLIQHIECFRTHPGKPAQRWRKGVKPTAFSSYTLKEHTAVAPKQNPQSGAMPMGRAKPVAPSGQRAQLALLGFGFLVKGPPYSQLTQAGKQVHSPPQPPSIVSCPVHVGSLAREPRLPKSLSYGLAGAKS